MNLRNRCRAINCVRPFTGICMQPEIKLFVALIALLFLFSVANPVQATITYRNKSPDKVDNDTSVSPAMPTANLSGSGGGGGSVGCFVSTAQEAYNQSIMNGLALLGLIVLLWQLISRIKARKSGRRRSYSQPGLNSAFDEVTEFEVPVMTARDNPGDTGVGGPAGKKGDVVKLTDDPPVAA